MNMKYENQSMKMSSSDALLKKEQELEAREKKITEQEDRLKSRWRNNLYDRITVSKKTMDIWVLGLSILLVLAVILGILFSQ